VAALPVDRWLAPEEENFFIGHGGGLTFWDGKDPETKGPQEIHYETRSGDLAFIDRAVWHQGEFWFRVFHFTVIKDTKKCFSQ
jgi:hypothetical protein